MRLEHVLSRALVLVAIHARERRRKFELETNANIILLLLLVQIILKSKVVKSNVKSLVLSIVRPSAFDIRIKSVS